MSRSFSLGIGLLAALVAAPALLMTPGSAIADPIFINVDEFGRGISFHPPDSGHSTLMSFYTVDKTTAGGGSHVLTYKLPFSVTALDVLVLHGTPQAPGDLGDLIRFDGSDLMRFYSLKDLGSSDGVADVASFPELQTIMFPGPNPGDPPVVVDNVFTAFEVGPEGSNDVLYIGKTVSSDPSITGSLFELVAHSDLPDPRTPDPNNPSQPLDPDQFITGVPEPSSLIIWGVAAISFFGWAGVRNRRRRTGVAA